MKYFSLIILLLFSVCSLHAKLIVRCFDKDFIVNPNIEYTYSQIENHFNSLISEKNLILKLDNESYSIPYSLLFQLAKKSIKDQISHIRKSQTRWDKINLSLFNKTKIYDLTPRFHPQTEFITKKIEEINSFYEKDIVPARVGELSGYKKIYRETDSERINIQKALKDFSSYLKEDFYDLPNITINLEKVRLSPSRTFDYFREKLSFNYLISEKTTFFNTNNINRNINMKKAIEAIDGIIIYPYDVFSYNKILGPRTLKAGYKTSIGISGGKLVPSVGGGICQVSSTLFYPVLMSGLTVIEQHNHSMRGPGLDYVPEAEDAAVVYSYKDFVFKNNSPSRKFLIWARMIKNTINIKIYSNEPNEYTYKLKKKSTRHGKSLSVKLWREGYKNGILKLNDFISTNNYTLFSKHP